MRPWILLMLTATLCACTQSLSAGAHPVAAAEAEAQSRLGAAWPRPMGPAAAIRLDSLDTPYVKDPAFVAGGRLIGDRRYITFGDLRRLYLKPFEAKNPLFRAPELAFGPGEVPITITGLPAAVDSPWAPEIVLRGDTLVMFYCAGEMPHPEPPRWPTFRLRAATAPVARFLDQVRAGRPVTFTDTGVVFPDLAPFGPNDQDFGVIDPALLVRRDGRAFLSYSVVRGGRAGRPHEEFVRWREVSAAEPTRALGPDTALYDGLTRTEDDGVAEAQDLVELDGKVFAFVSIRPGDIDQRIVVAPVGAEPGPIDRKQARTFLAPTGEGWRAKAVGSSSVAVIDGRGWILYQGLGADRRFRLGYQRIDF